MASLLNSPDAFKLYDVAVKYASSVDPQHRMLTHHDYA